MTQFEGEKLTIAGISLRYESGRYILNLTFLSGNSTAKSSGEVVNESLLISFVF